MYSLSNGASTEIGKELMIWFDLVCVRQVAGCQELHALRSKQRSQRDQRSWGLGTGLQIKFRKSERQDWHGTNLYHLEKEIKESGRERRGGEEREEKQMKRRKGKKESTNKHLMFQHLQAGQRRTGARVWKAEVYQAEGNQEGARSLVSREESGWAYRSNDSSAAQRSSKMRTEK